MFTKLWRSDKGGQDKNRFCAVLRQKQSEGFSTLGFGDD